MLQKSAFVHLKQRLKNGKRTVFCIRILTPPYERQIFTAEMRDGYTILIPQMSPIHFDFLEPALRACGYHASIAAAGG